MFLAGESEECCLDRVDARRNFSQTIVSIGISCCIYSCTHDSDLDTLQDFPRQVVDDLSGNFRETVEINMGYGNYP